MKSNQSLSTNPFTAQLAEMVVTRMIIIQNVEHVLLLFFYMTLSTTQQEILGEYFFPSVKTYFCSQDARMLVSSTKNTPYGHGSSA